ncbi:hypothetical protein HHK36_022038 [Tetracentron sinense]|uniref:PGG domain-containing protein n=1 Tax=Tetracentron sinense TaxID=13715 RepID=A0A835D9B2_TETSI|nr:hypothetical protein HHK36_022038 [Tetracentron sinense]
MKKLQGPELIEEQDIYGRTALHYAASYLSFEVARVLIESDSSVAYIQDKDGRTPLHFAAGKGDEDVTREIIGRYPDTVDLVDKRGQNVSFLHRKEDNKDNTIKEINSNQTTVAALIATVSFAAAFQVPGGYNSNDGTATLAKKAAFQVFVVTDAIALSCSMTAVFLNFMFTLATLTRDHNPRDHNNDSKIDPSLTIMFFTILILIAVIAMFAAFVAGLYAGKRHTISRRKFKKKASVVRLIVNTMDPRLYKAVATFERVNLIKEDADGIKERADLIKEYPDLIKKHADLIKQHEDLIKERSDLIKERTDLIKQVKEENPNHLLGMTPMGNTVFHLAAKVGDWNSVEKVYDEQCESLLAMTNSKGDTALHIAIRSGHLRIVNFLVEKSISASTSIDVEQGGNQTNYILEIQNQRNNTVLHEALRHCHKDVAKVLTERVLELRCVVNEAGGSPLYLAAKGGLIEIVRQVLLESSHPYPHGWPVRGVD